MKGYLLKKKNGIIKGNDILKITSCKPLLLSVEKTKCFPIMKKNCSHLVFSTGVNRINL